MKIIKKVLTKIIVCYLILYIMLSSVSTAFGATRNYDEACGEYLAQYAVDFCNQYGNKPDGYYDNSFAVVEPDSSFWTGGSFGQGNFHTCCTVGVAYMYYKALGVNIIELGADMGCPNHDSMKSKSNWVYISNESDLKPGDIVYNSEHAEMIIEGGHHVNFGNDHPGIVQEDEYGFQGGTFCCGFRLSSSVQVDPSGKVTGTAKKSGTQIDYSNFFFNGIPDGKYSLASADSLWDIIVEALKGMLDYFVGYLTYIIRIIIVGITSLFDKLLNNAVQSLNDAVPKSLIDSGVTATEVQDDRSEDRAVTIESLVFDQLELLDVNIFE